MYFSDLIEKGKWEKREQIKSEKKLDKKFIWCSMQQLKSFFLAESVFSISFRFLPNHQEHEANRSEPRGRVHYNLFSSYITNGAQ